MTDTAAPRASLRTAVLVIHGVGNQRPLETLRAAADALFMTDPAFNRPLQAGATPDDQARLAARLWVSFDDDNSERDIDLPVLTTSNIAPPGAPPHLVDFHECYWANEMSETRFFAVPLWLFELIRKGPAQMVSRIRPLWHAILILLNAWLLAACFVLVWAACWMAGHLPPLGIAAAAVWTTAIAAAGLCMGRRGVAGQLGLAAAACVLATLITGRLHLPMIPGHPAAMWVALGLLGMLALLNALVLQTVAGDAARYYRAAPANVGVRRAIRTLAVNRLDALNRDHRYDRIVVVAHSLGSVIGYDMLHAAWSAHCNRLGDPAAGDPDFAAQDRADGTAPGFDAAAWRARAAVLFAKLPGLTLPPAIQAAGGIKRRWLVSDFVTIGSPLTHARFLMAGGTTQAEQKANFRRRCEERELPQDPAWHVGGDGTLLFVPSPQRTLLHVGGMFGVMRWTNLHFPLSAVLRGDLVGGEVTSVFGRGVDDRQVPFGPFNRFAAHTHYFDVTDPAAAHLRALREAVDLRRTRAPTPVPAAPLNSPA